jgi:hypothetical protein
MRAQLVEWKDFYRKGTSKVYKMVRHLEANNLGIQSSEAYEDPAPDSESKE